MHLLDCPKSSLRISDQWKPCSTPTSAVGALVHCRDARLHRFVKCRDAIAIRRLPLSVLAMHSLSHWERILGCGWDHHRLLNIIKTYPTPSCSIHGSAEKNEPFPIYLWVKFVSWSLMNNLLTLHLGTIVSYLRSDNCYKLAWLSSNFRM